MRWRMPWDPWHHASMPCRPRKYQGHVSSARRRSPSQAHSPRPHSRISISLPTTRPHPPARIPPTRGSRNPRCPPVCDPGAPRGPPLVPRRWNNAAAPPPPPHREKIFFSPLLAPRRFSLLPSASPAARREIHPRTPPARRGEPRIRARPVEVMLLFFFWIFLGRFRAFCGSALYLLRFCPLIYGYLFAVTGRNRWEDLCIIFCEGGLGGAPLLDLLETLRISRRRV